MYNNLVTKMRLLWRFCQIPVGIYYTADVLFQIPTMFETAFTISRYESEA